MRRFLKIVLFLILLFIVAIVAIPFLVPAETIKSEVLAQIKARTGRDVTMGHAGISLFPTLGLTAQDVKIGNPDWTQGGNLAEIKTLKVGLELLPALHGKYHLKDLTLEDPVISLVKRQGKANWQFTGATKPAASGAAGKTSPAAASGSAHPATATELHLDNIAISGGTVTYSDDTGKTETVTGINLSIKAPDFNEKADISFSAVLSGKKADITLALGKPLAFMLGSATDISLKAGYGPFAFNWVGTFRITSGVPSITGKIDVPALSTADLSQKDAGAPAASSTAGGGAAAPAATSAPEGAARWSDAPIRLDGLRQANADITLSIEKLTLPKTTLENIVAHIRLEGGTLQARFEPLKAYGGTINLAVSANTGGALNCSFSAAGAQAEPLLHDFAGYDKLSGTIDTQVETIATGHSERALINSLAGQGKVDFKNGKLKGVNLLGLLKNPTGAQGADDSTDFSEFSGSYSISRGIVTTNDLKLAAPLLRMTGAGTVDLPNWEDHLLLKPTLVASRQGQSSKGDESGIVIPVAVDGPLDHPHYKPDLKAALQENLGDPSKLKDNVKGLLQGGTINRDSLKGLLR